MEIHHHHNHHHHQPLRLRFSFKSATIVLTVINVITILFFLQGFLSSSSTSSGASISSHLLDSAQLKYIKEAEEIRLKMQPLELIRRVQEIEQEVYAGKETEQKKEVKQNAAVDLSKRLKDFRSLNDASSLKALEEWRKRKLERARRRELQRHGTSSS